MDHVPISLFLWAVGDRLGIRINRKASTIPWASLRELRLVLIKANGLGSGLVPGLVGAMTTSVSTTRTALEVMRLGKHQVTALEIPVIANTTSRDILQSVPCGCADWFGFLRSIGKRHRSRSSAKSFPSGESHPHPDPISRSIYRLGGKTAGRIPRIESPQGSDSRWLKFLDCSDCWQ